MSDKVPRMKGGAVIDERSPLKDATDCREYQHPCSFLKLVQMGADL